MSKGKLILFISVLVLAPLLLTGLNCGRSGMMDSTTLPVILINSGESITTSEVVTLTLTPTIAATEMIIDNNPRFLFTGLWEKYSSSKMWNLGMDEGTKEVYVKFKDEAGNIYGPYSASIIFDPNPGEVKLISNEAIGANKWRITWINPIRGERIIISAESPSILNISPTSFPCTPNKISSSEVTTIGGNFSLSFTCIDTSGNISARKNHYFRSSEYLTITNEVAAASMNIVVGGEIKNNGKNLAKGVKITYSFFNPTQASFRKATATIGEIPPGEIKNYLIETALYYREWNYYAKYIEYEE